MNATEAPGQRAGEASHRGFSFASFARVSSQYAGHPMAFALSLCIVLAWAVSGPLFHFSDTWQLVINTGTSIVTFLMVFLIQHAQGRDATAVQLKLDELIRATKGARNVALDTEELPEEELDRLRDLYQALASRARQRAERELQTGVPDLESVAEDLEITTAPDTGARDVGLAQSEHRKGSVSQSES